MLCDSHISEDLVKNTVLEPAKLRQAELRNKLRHETHVRVAPVDGKQTWSTAVCRAKWLKSNGTLYLRTTVSGTSQNSAKNITVHTTVCLLLALLNIKWKNYSRGESHYLVQNCLVHFK